MKYIFFLIVLISFNRVNGQNNMIITDVQSEITNKKWTAQPSNPNALYFFFKKNEVSLIVAGDFINDTAYYFAEFEEVQNTEFSEEQIGRNSSGNYVVTFNDIFEIQLYEDRKSFRMQSIMKGKDNWQRYYLMED